MKDLDNSVCDQCGGHCLGHAFTEICYNTSINWNRGQEWGTLDDYENGESEPRGEIACSDCDDNDVKISLGLWSWDDEL